MWLADDSLILATSAVTLGGGQRKVLDQVAELTRDSGLIEISLSTRCLFNAVQVTKRLRQSTDVPIVWGGIPKMSNPPERNQRSILRKDAEASCK